MLQKLDIASMAQMYAGKPSSFYAATGGKPVEGAWYGSQRYLGGKLLAPGEHQPGQRVTDDVIAQTNPNNVSFVNQQRSLYANQIRPPVDLNLPSSQGSDMAGLQDQVNKYRDQLNRVTSMRLDTINADLAQKRQREEETLQQIDEVSQPFREDLENKERERLYINKNFEENQQLVDELDQLLTEGNDLIRQQQEVTGLASVRNPRIQKTMEDVNARAGVIQAVINARNGQIAQAQNMIDRSIGAIAADRQDRLNYYNTILELNNRDILNLTQESQQLAKEQRQNIQADLADARASANYVKELMINPDTAMLMGQAGVKLNDSVEVINAKLQQAQVAMEIREQANEIKLQGGQLVLDPSTVPQGQLVSFTDSTGREHYYKVPVSSGSGGGFDTNDYFQSIQSAQTMATTVEDPTYLNMILTETNNPILQFRPRFVPTGGPGTVYTDPETGYTWRHTNDGWEFIG